MVRAHLAPPRPPLQEPARPPDQELAGATAADLPAGRLLVAFSGGPDSTALLLWLVANRRAVVAAHFDHALRPESAAEAAAVARFCAALEVPVIAGRRDRPLPPGSRQAGARDLRLDFLAGAARATGAEAVALAHTADDVVEGMLLHLLRGSALPGLRGLPRNRGMLVRPLFATWHRDVEAYLRGAGVTPLRDPSNRDVERYARARVRYELLPRLLQVRPDLSARLWRVANRAGTWTEELERQARACGPDLERLRALPPAVRAEAYRQLHGDLPALGRRQLHAIDRLVLAGRTGGAVDLPAGRLWRERDRLVLEPRSADGGRWEELPEVRLRSCAGCDVNLAEGVHLPDRGAPPTLTVVRRRPGMRLRPAGGVGTRKLQDLLVDAGVPRRRRDALALVVERRPGGVEGHLLWVPGVARDALATIPPERPGWHLSLAPARPPGAPDRVRGKAKSGW